MYVLCSFEKFLIMESLKFSWGRLTLESKRVIICGWCYFCWSLDCSWKKILLLELLPQSLSCKPQQAPTPGLDLSRVAALEQGVMILSSPGRSSGPVHSVPVLIMRHSGSSGDSADGPGWCVPAAWWDKWCWSLLGAVLTSLWEQQLLRAGTAGGTHLPVAFCGLASMEVEMNKSCKVRVCQQPEKGQIWATTVHCVCQRRAKWTEFTPGFLPELLLSCDLGLDLPCVVGTGSREGIDLPDLDFACFIFFPPHLWINFPASKCQ